jgi:hypothetical protein
LSEIAGDRSGIYNTADTAEEKTAGSMIPPADTDGKESDGRKNGRCRRKEARLTLPHPKGSVTAVFGGKRTACRFE